MRYCPKCFTKLPENANYCPMCGECVREISTSESSSVDSSCTRVIVVGFKDKAIRFEQKGE